LSFEFINDFFDISYINRQQSEEILGLSIDFSQNQLLKDILFLKDDIIAELKTIVLQGYPIREYRNFEKQLSYKCEELHICLESDLDKDLLRELILQARVFGIMHVFLVGNVFLYNDIEEILIFMRKNGFFVSVLYDGKNYLNISNNIWNNIDCLIIQSNKMSTSQLSDFLNYIYNKKVICQIINYLGDPQLLKRYDGIINLSSAERARIIFNKNYFQLEFLNEIKQYDFEEQFSIATFWWNFMEDFKLYKGV